MDYQPRFPYGNTKVLTLSNQGHSRVYPEKTTSDNIHFDFRFDNHPLPVSARQTFYLSEGSGASVCVDVWGYYASYYHY